MEETEKPKQYLLKVADKELTVNEYEIGTAIDILGKMDYKEFRILLKE